MKAVDVAIIELLDFLYGALDLQQDLAASLLKFGATETTDDRNVACDHVLEKSVGLKEYGTRSDSDGIISST